MSEYLYDGPLDKARRASQEACDLDEALREQQGDEPIDRPYYAQHIDELDKQTPYRGQEVIMYGVPLTCSVDEDGALLPLAYPGQGHETDGIVLTQGLYQGYYIQQVYDTENKTVDYRMLHAVITEDALEIDEGLRGHNESPLTMLTFFEIHASEVVPVVPLNIHSMQDLQGDRTIVELDKIAAQIDLSRLEKIQLTGQVVGRMVMDETVDEDIVMQRVSYANSLGFLDGGAVLADDLVITSRARPFDPDETKCNIKDKTIALPGGVFDLGVPYDRVDDNTARLTNGTELYVRVPAHDDRVVMVPVRNILDFKNLETID